jgi:dihydrofolate reductase
MKNISIIVAIANDNAIGKDNKLLWHISEDLKRFKRLTTGHTVVMGKKTYESLPLRPLPDRRNMVITDIPGEVIDGCVMAYSIEDAIAKCDEDKENFIVGGGSVYRQFLKYVNKLYVTKVHQSFDADTFFPAIDLKEWRLIEEHHVKANEKNRFDYTYLIYIR